MRNTIFVGLDVHKATISVAIAHGERGGEVRHLGTIPNRADHVRRLAEKLGRDGRQLHFCYEAGSGLARRALVEGAWSYRMQARVSRKLLDRIEALPQTVRDIAWNGQLRMCQRYRHLMAAGKPKVVATTAIAREMVGFIWAIARTVTPARA